jgi:hypothetical protein
MVYANIKLQGATSRSEDSIKLREGRSDPQANKSYPRSLDSSGPQLRPRNTLTLVEYIGHTRYLDPINLKGVTTRLSSRYFWQHQLFSPQLQCVKTIYIFGKRKSSKQLKVSTRSWKSNLLKSNSNLVSAPLTTTLRNLGTRFCLRGKEL